MVIVNSGEFRTEQEKYLDLIDKREKVIIQRDENKSYVIMSFNERLCSPRKNWAEAAKQMHLAGDDELLMPEIFDDEKLEWWTKVVSIQQNDLLVYQMMK
jgi:antitoxin MazE